MTSQPQRAFADVAGEAPATAAAGLDRLRIARVPLVPEIRLLLAEDAIVWWARMEAEAGARLAAPFWASAWVGGQAVARYVLDHPEVAAGRRVLDLASGSGLVAIAASMAGAVAVTANDIDPYAITAIALNATTNGVDITPSCCNLLDCDGGDAELVLAGDVFYDKSMAETVTAFLRRVTARGARVLVGDPGRTDLPRHQLEIVATYPATDAAAFEDSEIEQVHVLTPASCPSW